MPSTDAEHLERIEKQRRVVRTTLDRANRFAEEARLRKYITERAENQAKQQAASP